MAFLQKLISTVGVIELVSAILTGLVSALMMASPLVIALIATIGALVPLCARLYWRSAHAIRQFERIETQLEQAIDAIKAGSDLAERVDQLETGLQAIKVLNDEISRLADRAAQAEGRIVNLDTRTTDLAKTATTLRSGLITERVDQLDTGLQAIKVLNDEISRLADRAAQAEGRIVNLDTRTTDLAKTATTLRSGLIQVARGARLPHGFYGIDVFDPEVDMLPLLASVIAQRTAIDVGANRGEWTAALRRAGFSVDAFEPLPELSVALGQRFRDDPHVRVHAMACSDQIGTATLHTVDISDGQHDSTLFSSLNEHPVFSGFAFSSGMMVPTTTLNNALADGKRLQVGLLKIDTEGHDLAVLRGATRIDAQVLLVEFWDKEHVFNKGEVRNTLGDYLTAIEQERYPFHVIFWRQSGFDQFGVTIGGMETPPGSWGNVLFLSDEKLLKMLMHWAGETYGLRHLHVIIPCNS
jgi:FkbM family methyltransferase